jgi:hypothetical protein
VKCAKCHELVGHMSIVVTVVQETCTYAAVLHPLCLRTLVGQAHARKLESVAFLSGWSQLGLPMLHD